MKKAELIKEVIGMEFHFDEYGICGVREDGIVVHWGEPCRVEHNGKLVIANLWKLPKVWVECCLNSSYWYEWIPPEYAHKYNEYLMKEMKEEFENV